MTVWAIVLAAGPSSRFGARSKQFADLDGASPAVRAVTAATAACDRAVVVLPARTRWSGPPVTATVAGGWTRSTSVRSGLAVVPPEAEVVVVHDAAHPLATEQLFVAVIAAIRDGADAAIPGVPTAEAVKRCVDGHVVEDLGRDGLVLTQCPQAYRAAALREAHDAAPETIEDSALIAAAGGCVAVVPGDPANIHVTTPADLDLAAHLLRRRRTPS